MAVITITALLIGAVGLYAAASLVSFLAHWLAVAGGLAALVLILRLLVDQRPMELFGNEVLDNLSYLALAVPVGFLAYRLLEAVLVAVSILIVLLLVAAIVVMALLGPGRVVSFVLTIADLAGGE